MGIRFGVAKGECVAEIRLALMRMNNTSEENWRSSYRSCVATANLSQDCHSIVRFQERCRGMKVSLI
jgi:hypothetical protein